jgi:serine/threonine protein kinase
MAVVYRARDERLGRPVALKVLAPVLADHAEFRRRFTAESRAAAVVDDPHIIPVYEAGEVGGVLFIAMRLVTGGDLRRVLTREGPLPPERAAALLSPVASALDAAHRAGLVHRDVKPANVLVDVRPGRPDHVYLSDAGPVAVAGGTVYVGTQDGSVHALDAATGKARWTCATGSAVDSSPTVAGGTVYLNSTDNSDKVYALDATTGKARWTYTGASAFNGSPVVAGSTVYVGSGHEVYALSDGG